MLGVRCIENESMRLRTGQQRSAAAQEAWSVNPWDPQVELFCPPPLDSLPMPELPIYHPLSSRAPKPLEAVAAASTTSRELPTILPNGRGSSYFIVTPAAQVQQTQQVLEMSEAEFVQTQVADALQRSDRLMRADEEIAPTHSNPTEYSPWLELRSGQSTCAGTPSVILRHSRHCPTPR
ncbi:uncharacterized protein PFLUO_LOCUS3784 [Penicillium psychrofluorescens]|uniref:uncharacterized protein n=1 Tax=Penicillium psychrofluorescens TaxID=3158075 RepID=UPI003CCDC733